MSSMPFSVRVAIRIDVPRNPVCKQRSCCAKFLRRRSIIFALASPSKSWFFRANKAGVCIVLRMAVLKVPSSLRKFSLMYAFAESDICWYLAASRPVAAAISRIMEASITQQEALKQFQQLTASGSGPWGEKASPLQLSSGSQLNQSAHWQLPFSPQRVSWLYFVSLMQFINKSIAFQFSSMICVSPNCFHTVQGTMIPASAQPKRIFSSPYCAKGATPGNPPKLFWVSRMSRIHLWKNFIVLAKNVPVSANTCVSAVHPRRSSRCGQSVGIDRQLDSCPQ